MQKIDNQCKIDFPSNFFVKIQLIWARGPIIEEFNVYSKGQFQKSVFPGKYIADFATMNTGATSNLQVVFHINLGMFMFT